ncbi:MAG TPA: UvrD-helicase domain-containing protein [Propionibacteriaceae bacterium]
MTALHDAEARRAIQELTDSTIFVEAGAGSGKTKSLVDRILTLTLRDGIPIANIAAVTFTEKAGAELRDRLRAEFERQLWSGGEQQRLRAEAALDELDSAAIGTLHAFAQRILTMHAIEAGLPPLLEVLDEVASSVAFDERWSVLQRELLDDESLSETLLLALSANVKLEHLRSLARAFGSDWDLIEDRVLTAPRPTSALPDPRELVELAAKLAARSEECSQVGDLFLPRLQELAAWAERLRQSRGPGEHYSVLLSANDLKWGYGRAGAWTDLSALKESCQDLQRQASQLASDFAEATLRPLAHWIAAKVYDAARARAAEGRLEFHDLLVLARGLVRGNAEVRAALQRQFPRILLDEFQDTDPIQTELAVRIAGGAEADQTEWRDVRVPSGSLFVVGDPKQSIYRFRRANIGMYLKTQEWFANTVNLTTNFRTAGPVLDWVNQTFAQVITPVTEAQPPYEALRTYRTEAGSGPAVTVLGSEAHADKPKADDVRGREAADVAAVIGRALAEGWTIWDRKTQDWRRLRLGDIAVLLPARTSLPFLETALDGAGIAYRAESSSLVYEASEVRSLFAAARAVADPSDGLSLVSALRSPLFGCGDDDLWTWKIAGGSFNVLAPVDEEQGEHPVGRAMAYLRHLHYDSRWLTPSEVLAAVVADRRMLEVSALGPRAQDSWRRLRFVVDQARAWSEVEHGGLRAYLAWAARQSEEGSRVAEAILPETDVDAVRVLTVHAAKGLEFPMVVMSGMSSQANPGRGVRLIWPPSGGYSVRLTKHVQTNDFEAVLPLDEQMDSYERRRLLYVAATRARDHLVVSMHRDLGGRATNAKVLAGVIAGVSAGVETFVGSATQALDGAAARVVTPPPEWSDWLAGVTAARQRSRWKAAESASGLEGTDPLVALDVDRSDMAGEAKGARDVELPPWSKGRYGSAIGRAVHAVLQAVDLADGSGLESAVQTQCVAEGVVGHSEVVEALVRSALASDLVKRAAVRPHWRECYVGTLREDGTVLEGIVDLIYREDDGSYVVVDYKTDAIPAAAVQVRVAYYRPQIRAYLDMVKLATGTATQAHLLFLNPERSVTRAVT